MTTYEYGVRWDDNTEEWHGGQESLARARAKEYRGRLIRRPLSEVVEDFRPCTCFAAASDPGPHHQSADPKCPLWRDPDEHL